mgnify:CR=1 FL=1
MNSLNFDFKTQLLTIKEFQKPANAVIDIYQLVGSFELDLNQPNLTTPDGLTILDHLKNIESDIADQTIKEAYLNEFSLTQIFSSADLENTLFDDQQRVSFLNEILTTFRESNSTIGKVDSDVQFLNQNARSEHSQIDVYVDPIILLQLQVSNKVQFNATPEIRFEKSKFTKDNKLALLQHAPKMSIIHLPVSTDNLFGHIIVVSNQFEGIHATSKGVSENPISLESLDGATLFAIDGDNLDSFTQFGVNFLRNSANRMKYSGGKAVQCIRGGYTNKRSRNSKLSYSISKDIARQLTDNLEDSSKFCSQLAVLAVQVALLKTITGDEIWINLLQKWSTFEVQHDFANLSPKKKLKLLKRFSNLGIKTIKPS